MNQKVDHHITISSMTPAGAGQIFPLFREDITELVRWFGFDENYSLENEMQYLEERVLPYDDALIVYWNNNPCGRLGIYDYDADRHSIYLYYWVSSRYRRKGIARRCIGAALDYLRTIGIREVLFDVDRENIPSIRLLERFPKAYIKDTDHEKNIIYAIDLL